MPRPPKFDHDEILDAALGLLATGGPRAASAAAVARAMSAPNGSIYHRFAGRDHLVGAVWLRAVRRFQHGWRAALAQPDALTAGRDAACHVVSWSRAHWSEATVLARYGLEDVLTAEVPAELAVDAHAQRRDVTDALCGYLTAHQIPTSALPRVRLAVIGIPYAAVRDALADGAPPARAHEQIASEAAAALLRPLIVGAPSPSN